MALMLHVVYSSLLTMPLQLGTFPCLQSLEIRNPTPFRWDTLSVTGKVL